MSVGSFTPTARVIFMAKKSLDIFSLSREQVWTFLISCDRIYEIRYLFVAVGPNALIIVLPHWDNMSFPGCILGQDYRGQKRGRGS